MRIRSSFRIWKIVPFLLAIVLPCQAAQFTAELTITSPQGNFVYDLSVKDDLLRLEKTAGPMTVPPFPTIYNRQTGITWGLLPEMRQYVEETDPVKTMVMNPVAGWAYMREEMTGTPAGTETVEGYPCELVEYRETGKDYVAFRVWESKQLVFNVKEVSYATNGNATMALRNIEEGPVDDARFSIPSGYTKIGATGGTGERLSKRSDEEKKTSASGNLVFILDASGSMWGQVEGKAKIAIAKEVLTELVKELPDDAVVGLVAYGHRRKGDCDDVEELIPMGPLKKEKMVAKIQALSPKGKTPISRSVRLTAERLKRMEDETTIILVSDGKETCDPDPCGLVKELKDAGIKFVMHVIGFDVTEEEREQLECMAGAGGGQYYTAGNAGEFLAAAREVVEAPTFTGGYLKVTSVKEGEPFAAGATVHRQDDNKNMGSKSTWYHEKPAEFKLAPGTYACKVTDRSVQPYQTREIRDIAIASGQTVEKTVVFGGSGILRITAVKDDQPFNAKVTVFNQGNNKPLPTKSTWYNNKPAEYELVPGVYYLKVTDRSVEPYQTQEIRDIAIASGQTVEKTVAFGGSGILRITAVKEDQPFNASVTVFNQGNNKPLPTKSTWYNNKPAEYELVPGVYYLKVTDRSVQPYQTREIRDIAIASGQTVEKTVAFGGSGILRITTVKDDQPFNAKVTVFNQGNNKPLPTKSTWYHKKPAEYELVPGVYYLKVTDRSVQPYQTREIRDIAIASGQTMEKSVAFVSGGILRITTVKDDQPFNAKVTVFNQGNNKPLLTKSTWYQNRPAEYELVPGVYYLKVTDRSETPYQTKEVRDIEILSGQTVEKSVAF